MGVPSHKRVSFAMVSATSINNSIFEVGFHLEMSTLKVAAISSGVLKGAKFLTAFHASRFLCHRSPRGPSHSLCDNLWSLAACLTCISKKHGLLRLHSSMELSSVRAPDDNFGMSGMSFGTAADGCERVGP